MLPDCHLASGTEIVGGYILVYVPDEKRQFLAHRLAWTRANGPIPVGLQVCHRCDTPPCDNVDHLFLGTPLENIQDAKAKGRFQRRTTCKRGHSEYSTGKHRRCLACHREETMQRRARTGHH